MDFRALHHYSRAALRGHYGAALRTAWLVPGLFVLYRIVPAGLGGLLQLRGTIPPGALWSGSWLWMSFCILWALFCQGMLLPVRCAVWNRFGELLGLTRLRICFSRTRTYLHAAWVCGMAKLLQLAAAFPTAASALTAWRLLQESARRDHGALWLFGAVQAGTLMLWTGVFWFRLRVSLLAVPMLCTELPQAGAWTVIRRSVRMLENRHRTYWGIYLCYLPAMLPVVTIPFLLPRLYSDLTLFLQIRLRETENA